MEIETPKINGLAAKKIRPAGDGTTSVTDPPKRDEVERIHEQLLAAIRRSRKAGVA